MDIKKWLQVVCLSLLAWATVEVALFARSLRLASVELERNLSTLRTDLIPLANGTVIQAGLVLDQVMQAASSQQESAQAAIRDSARATKAAADTLERANAVLGRVERDLVPQATKTLADTSASLQRLTGEAAAAIKGASDQLAPVLDGAAKSTVSLNRILEEDVPPVLHRAEATVENLEQTTQHAEDLVEHYKKKLMKPAHWAKTVALTVLEFGAKVGSIFAGFVK